MLGLLPARLSPLLALPAALRQAGGLLVAVAGRGWLYVTVKNSGPASSCASAGLLGLMVVSRCFRRLLDDPALRVSRRSRYVPLPLGNRLTPRTPLQG